MEEVWIKEFETFYSGVGDRPSEHHRMHRKDKSKKWGPDNWEWREDLFKRSYKIHDQKEYLKAWRKAKPDYHREKRYKTKYKITIAKYDEMLKEQGGVCAGCGNPETQSQQGDLRKLAVDHDHVTGNPRELLENNCNAILGHAKDSPQLLIKLVLYLAKHSPDRNLVIDNAIKQLQEAR